jgi:hypothetical protein
MGKNRKNFENLTSAETVQCAPMRLMGFGISHFSVRLITGFMGLLTALTLFPSEGLAQGCAMCKTALSGAEDPLAIGIFWSALLMMSMPFVLFASIGGWIFYQYRSADRPVHPPAAVLPFEIGSIKKKEDLP